MANAPKHQPIDLEHGGGLSEACGAFRIEIMDRVLPASSTTQDVEAAVKEAKSAAKVANRGEGSCSAVVFERSCGVLTVQD